MLKLMTLPPPLDRLTVLATVLVALTLLPTLATAEVVRAHNNYKPVIVLDNPGRNVLTGCGDQGRVATLRLRIPPKQDDGNAWTGFSALYMQATGDHRFFEFRNRRGAITGWTNFYSNGRASLGTGLIGQHTIEVRQRTGQNIGYGGGGEMYLTLNKTADSREFDKYKVYNPAIRILAGGGKGCQTLTQNPTCRGFWSWAGGVPTCLLSD